MKKTYIRILMLLMIAVWTNHVQNVYAFGGSAIEYFDMGLKASMANQKINYFTTALELNPGLAAAYEKRGLHYYFQEKYDKVIEDFTHYIRLVPDKADAYRMLGMAYLKVGNNESAIVNFNEALSLKPELKTVFSYRAEAFRLNGQIDRAIEDANKAIAAESDLRALSDVYRTRGRIYQESGQERLASADFKKAAEIDPRYFLYQYISSYADLEDMRRAGLFGMIGMAFVLIFGFKLNPPEKDE